MRTATDEISLCGCYIETMFTMELGTKLTLVFSLNAGKIQAQGIVTTRFPQVGNGVDFVVMGPADRAKLAEYIGSFVSGKFSLRGSALTLASATVVLHWGNFANYFRLPHSVSGTNTVCHSVGVTISLDRDMVLRLAFIRGRGCGRFCTVRAIKAKDPIPPNLYRCPITVQEKDDFPDGNYDLVLGAQTFVLKKRRGDYLPIMNETSPEEETAS